MNLANKLTVMRMILVPIFLVFLVFDCIPYGKLVATALFIIASITDKLDGYIARSRNQVTNFGKFMDPLADKLLVTAALISLVELNCIPAWAVVVIIAREFAVSGLRTIAASDGNVIAASWWGKIKTVIQMIAIILLLLKVSISEYTFLSTFIGRVKVLSWIFNSLSIYMFYIAVIITIISGVDYFIKNKESISTTK
ncbi:MAG: CDP-diacylglycerol--glycerol-3-phosphate 3-phosphatidyltransferase [Clostridium sp.]|nr:CDP-diacylglycerol--glycerol-3-phosphate 3-phosphatidyltransferase [Clostridium sp.]